MAATLILCAGSANAGTTTVTGGTIHFKGKLVAAPCAVSTDSDGQTVKLGEYTTHHFKAAGTLGTLTPFQIKLEDCDTTTASTAAVAFSGRQDASNADLLAIDAGMSGDNKATATGVGIQILDEKSKVVVPDGSSFSSAHTLIDGENILNFGAQYKSTAAATAGDANADATFIMQYQ
jgi:type 1 fimbria pilin